MCGVDLTEGVASGPDAVASSTTSRNWAGHALRLSSSTGVRGHVELRMVEDVERLSTELKRSAFLDRTVLEYAHIEVQTAGITGVGSAGVAKRQTSRKRERCGVEVVFCIAGRRYLTGRRNSGERVADLVRERSRAHCIADTSVIPVGCCVGDGQWNSSGERFNA